MQDAGCRVQGGGCSGWAYGVIMCKKDTGCKHIYICICVCVRACTLDSCELASADHGDRKPCGVDVGAERTTINKGCHTHIRIIDGRVGSGRDAVVV